MTQIQPYQDQGRLKKIVNEASKRMGSPVDKGYIVMFDPNITDGKLCVPKLHQISGKEVLSLNIGIGKG